MTIKRYILVHSGRDVVDTLDIDAEIDLQPAQTALLHWAADLESTDVEVYVRLGVQTPPYGELN